MTQNMVSFSFKMCWLFRHLMLLTFMMILIFLPAAAFYIALPLLCHAQIGAQASCSIGSDSVLQDLTRSITAVTAHQLLTIAFGTVKFFVQPEFQESAESRQQHIDAARRQIVESMRFSVCAMVMVFGVVDVIRTGSLILAWNKALLTNMLMLPLVHTWFYCVASGFSELSQLGGTARECGRLCTLSLVLMAVALLPSSFHSASSMFGWNYGLGGGGALLMLAVSSIRIANGRLLWCGRERSVVTAQKPSRTCCEAERAWLSTEMRSWWVFRVGINAGVHLFIVMPQCLHDLVFQRHRRGTVVSHVLVRMLFTYNFACLTTICAIMAFSVLFHLITYVVAVHEPLSATLLKLLVLAATCWNFMAPAETLLGIMIDSWQADMPAASGTLLHAIDDARHWASGIDHAPGGGDNDGACHGEATIRGRARWSLVAEHVAERRHHYTRVHTVLSNTLRSAGALLVGTLTVVVLVVRLGHQVGLDTSVVLGYETNLMSGHVNATELAIDHTYGRVRLFRPQSRRNNIFRQEREPICDDAAAMADGTALPYGTCGMQWGNLTSFDYALLSNLVYFDHKRTTQLQMLQQAVATAFPPALYGAVHVVQDWTIDGSSRSQVGEAKEVFDKFIRVEFSDLKLWVVAVQGTCPTDLSDLLADVRLWSESVLIAGASIFFPTLRAASTGMVAQLIYIMSLGQKFFAIESVELDYYESVVRYIHKLLPLSPGWRIIVTGHSLGGGIATIAGATLGINSIAFSPPGFVRSRRKFETLIRGDDGDNVTSRLRPRVEAAASGAVSFLPARDLIHLADEHLGLVQHTVCRHTDSLTCHSPEFMVCDLLTRCGDGHGGRRFVDCAFDRHLSSAR